jgi:hypothetical protein
LHIDEFLGETVPNTGDFDPAEAIRQQRAVEEAEEQREEIKKKREEAEKKRRQAQEDLRRADILKLLRYADEQLEDIRTPILSEFVITERWVTRGIFGGLRSHRREQARHYGSWLALRSTRGTSVSKSGLVKLRQPRYGYAFVRIDNDWDPRNVGHLDLALTNDFGTKIDSPCILRGTFRIVTSLEEVTERIVTAGTELMFNRYTSLGELTKAVEQALDFVATSQPPEPEYIRYDS